MFLNSKKWFPHAVPILGNSSVGTATRYELDGPGIQSWWRARFSAPVLTDPGAQLTSYTMDI
jgi:hypothetical protein